MKQIQEANEAKTDWTIFANVRATLFPICFMPLKCLSGSETFIGADKEKYVYWTAPTGELELIRLKPEQPAEVLMNVHNNIVRKNMSTYIPSFILLKNEDGTNKVVWDHEASLPETISLFSEQHEVMSVEKYMASMVQYLPIAFNAYTEVGKPGIQLEVLDISESHLGKVKTIINNLGSFMELKNHIRNNIKNKKITFDGNDIIFEFDIPQMSNLKQSNLKMKPLNVQINNQILECNSFEGESLATIRKVFDSSI